MSQFEKKTFKYVVIICAEILMHEWKNYHLILRQIIKI